MKTTYISFIFYLLQTSVFGQINQIDSIEYLKQSKAFIDFITKNSDSSKKFLMSDKPTQLVNKGCDTEIQNDTVNFTKYEMIQIHNQISIPSLTHWTSDLVPKAKLISSQTLKSIFSNRGKEWKYFYKHFGRSYISYSAPIFLRNYSYCLFYSAQYCGGTCGGGIMQLYKKEGTLWIKIRSYCFTIS